MTEIIPFPARKPRLVQEAPDEAVPEAPSSLISSFIIAMGASVDSLQLRGYIHERQGKLLERWADESVHHLGHDVVIEMLESMTLHLMQEKCK